MKKKRIWKCDKYESGTCITSTIVDEAFDCSNMEHGICLYIARGVV